MHAFGMLVVHSQIGNNKQPGKMPDSFITLCNHKRNKVIYVDLKERHCPAALLNWAFSVCVVCRIL